MFGGQPAKDIGICAAVYDSRKNAELIVELTSVRRIIKICSMIHKRMPELIGLGYVTRDEEGKCFITDTGMDKLK